MKTERSDCGMSKRFIGDAEKWGMENGNDVKKATSIAMLKRPV